MLKIHYDEFDCLLTGDATFPTENSIINRYDADWLDVMCSNSATTGLA